MEGEKETDLGICRRACWVLTRRRRRLRLRRYFSSSC